jgi:uncharacterized membrane protein
VNKYSLVGGITLLLGLTQSFTALFFVSSVLGRLQMAYEQMGVAVRSNFVTAYVLMTAILLSGVINLLLSYKLLSLTPHEMSAYFKQGIFFAVVSFILTGIFTIAAVSLAISPIYGLSS